MAPPIHIKKNFEESSTNRLQRIQAALGQYAEIERKLGNAEIVEEINQDVATIDGILESRGAALPYVSRGLSL